MPKFSNRLTRVNLLLHLGIAYSAPTSANISHVIHVSSLSSYSHVHNVATSNRSTTLLYCSIHVFARVDNRLWGVLVMENTLENT